MDEWKEILRGSLRTPDDLAKHFGLNPEETRKIARHFKTQITPYYASLIKEKGDPIWKQVVPDAAELACDSGVCDPLREDDDSPVPSIVHRYPDRLLFLVSHMCASYCRFCTRKRKVGNALKISPLHIEAGLDYIRAHDEVRDVIVSGGDPLMLSDARIESILKALRAIPHIEILRIGTRVPCFLPQRVTPEARGHTAQVPPALHQHPLQPPRRADPGGRRGPRPPGRRRHPARQPDRPPEGRQRRSGRHAAAHAEAALARVKPYYIYQADYVQGTEHLRTTVEKGIEIVQALRGWTSGLAVPYYVIDAPGGGGKIPVLPKYVQTITEEHVIMKNYAGGDLLAIPRCRRPRRRRRGGEPSALTWIPSIAVTNVPPIG